MSTDIRECPVPVAPVLDLPRAIIANHHAPRRRDHRLDRDLRFGALWRLTFDRETTWAYDAYFGCLALVLFESPHGPAWPRRLIALVCLVGFWASRLRRTRKLFAEGYLVTGRGNGGTAFTFDFAGKTYTAKAAMQPCLHGQSYRLVVLPQSLDAPLALETLRLGIGRDGNLEWLDAARKWRLVMPLIWIAALVAVVVIGVA